MSLARPTRNMNLVIHDEASIDHDALLNYRVEEHREIDDSGIADTDLWSAEQIISEFDDVDTAIAALDAAKEDSVTWGDGLQNPSGTASVDLVASGGLKITSGEIEVDDANVDHDSLNNYVLAQHRIINDSGSAVTDLWSADKIATELAAEGLKNIVEDETPQLGGDLDVNGHNIQVDDDFWIGLAVAGELSEDILRSIIGIAPIPDDSMDDEDIRHVAGFVRDFVAASPAGHIEFSDLDTDEINFIDCNVNMSGDLDVDGAITATGFIIGGNTLDTNEFAYLDGQDQSVKANAAPTFTADNFSDGGSNAIITTTQETNFETAYSHSQVAGGNSVHVSVAENNAWDAAYAHIGNDGSDHSFIDQAVLIASDVTFNDITISTPSNIYALSHDSFADFVANEHIDWTGESAGTIDATNIEDKFLRNDGNDVTSGIITSAGLTIGGNTLDTNEFAYLDGQDQSVKANAAPAFTADNFSDGGSNAIITTTQETNFGAAYTHVSNNGSDHSFIDQSVVIAATPEFAGLGIGVSDPDTTLEVFNAGTQLKLSYDASNFITLATQSDGDLTIDSNKASYDLDFGDGNLITTGEVQLIGSDTDPGALKWSGSSYNVEAGCSADGSSFHIYPTTEDVVNCYLGSDIWSGGAVKAFDLVSVRAKNGVYLLAADTAFNYQSAQLYLIGGSTPYAIIKIGEESGSTTNDYLFYHESFQPELNNGQDLGASDKAWKNCYIAGVINSGNHYPATDDTHYLGKNDDDSPLAWKGLILKDTTNGKYYRIEIINGTITATDLTD